MFKIIILFIINKKKSNKNKGIQIDVCILISSIMQTAFAKDVTEERIEMKNLKNV